MRPVKRNGNLTLIGFTHCDMISVEKNAKCKYVERASASDLTDQRSILVVTT